MLSQLLDRNDHTGSALGAFTCYDLPTVVAVIAAAEESNAGVCLLLSAAAFASPYGELLADSLVSAAARSSLAVSVQLDHVSDLETIRRAFCLGVDSAMADGSRLSFAENISFVQAAQAIAAPFGATIEAELGRVEGDEDASDLAEQGERTRPEDAARFAALSGVDALAVSIGNVHGRYRTPPRLDWALLAEIRQAVPVPLTLHGASGLPAAAVSHAIKLGIRKVNFNHELRQAQFDVLQHLDAALTEGADVIELQRSITDSVRNAVTARLACLKPSRQGAAL